MRFYFRRDLAKAVEAPDNFSIASIKDKRLAKLAAWAAGIVVILFFLVGFAELFGFQSNLNLGTASLAGAAVVFLLSARRREILKSVDWGIIIFFLSLFIVVQGFWSSNALQSVMSYLPGLDPSDQVASLGVIILASLIFS